MFSGTMKWLCVESFRFGNIITEIRLPAGGAPATFGLLILTPWGAMDQLKQ